MERGEATQKVLRVCAWMACGAALLLVPAVGETVLDAARQSGGSRIVPLFAFYLWTNALPLGLVAAAVANALSGRLVAYRRRICSAAIVAILAYLGVCALWYSGDIKLVSYVSWVKMPLRLLAWCLWGMLLPLWAMGEATSRSEAAPSPITDAPGAERLTDREREVVELLLTGSTLAQTSEALGISSSSAATYRTRACEKLGVTSIGELILPETGAAALPRPFDVESSAAWPLALITLCASLVLGMLARSTSLTFRADVLFALALLGLPWAVLAIVSRFRGLRVRVRLVTGRFGLVLLSLAFFGVIFGGSTASFIAVPLGNVVVSMGLPAAVVYVGCVAWLAPYLLWPVERVTSELDEERCVLYLRGRGAGELQARVLTEIAGGRASHEICESLHVARGTVNAYRAQGYELLGVHTSRELASLLARDVGRIPSAGKKHPPAEDTKTDV